MEPISKAEAGLAAAIHDLTQRKKIMTYYKQEYAVLAKGYLDRLHSSGKAVRVSAIGLSVNTIRLQFYQGAKFLVEHLDTADCRYADYLARTTCHTYADCIELAFKYRPIIPTADVAPSVLWKEIDEFIETSQPKDKFVRTELSLTTEDIAFITNMLTPLESLFMFKVESSEVLIIRDEMKGPQ